MKVWNRSAIKATVFPYPDDVMVLIHTDLKTYSWWRRCLFKIIDHICRWEKLTPSLLLRRKPTESSSKSYTGSTMFFFWCQVGGSQQLLERHRRECVVSNGAIKLLFFFYFWHDVQFGVKAALALQSHHRWAIFSNSPRAGSQIWATPAATDSKLHRSEKRKEEAKVESVNEEEWVSLSGLSGHWCFLPHNWGIETVSQKTGQRRSLFHHPRPPGAPLVSVFFLVFLGFFFRTFESNQLKSDSMSLSQSNGNVEKKNVLKWFKMEQREES